jgi:formylglycine-generating enzyme required for sulfatase activity
MIRLRLRIVLLAHLSLALVPLHAQDSDVVPGGGETPQIPGPACHFISDWNTSRAKLCTPAETAAWLADIQRWRSEDRLRMGYDASQYDWPEMLWTQTSFIQPQMMVHDRYFYDPIAQHYTAGRYLDDVDSRYGGIDSVLLWHTYPNLGIDNRNQFDLFHDLPGGVPALRKMIEEFHQRGVRVLFPVMMWDQGTRDEGMPYETAIAKELTEVGADGINGDTLEGFSRAFRVASDLTSHPLALEPELTPVGDEMLAWNNLSWGEGWKHEFLPPVSRDKWLESRHMVNIVNRWAHDRTDDLQQAFFDGVGYVSWENIWGIWNGFTPRDGEALRRSAAIERALGALLNSPEWEPYSSTEQFGVFASKWTSAHAIAWTMVNRNHYVVSGHQLVVAPMHGAHFYDLWHGLELSPEPAGSTSVVLSFAMEADGFGAVLESDAPLSQRLVKLLQQMHQAEAHPLANYSASWQSLPQTMVPAASTPNAGPLPDNMLLIPAADYVFRVAGIEIEGMNDEGVDVQYPWEASARRYHAHQVHIAEFRIDRYPVSNAEFKAFLSATSYHPADDHNFLRDWKDGAYPAGWGKKPVTWVSIEDARAYAKWAGKRLAHEWEWQYAAQGQDSRAYPWGDTWNPAAVPTPNKSRQMDAPSDSDAHPDGASLFGVMDLVGNVWQWTDEYCDAHTCAAILKGGSHYQPQGSRWYFPQAYRLSEHGKYLLMAPSLDRAATVGFRCVQDLPN